ncbi:MAG TPA: DUF1801 domain-containing protein [Rhodothermales bacterium]
MDSSTKPKTVDAYIASFEPEVRTILERIRSIAREELPQAEERLGYGIPGYYQNGPVFYFAGFKNHIGLYPPVGDPALVKKLTRYRGEKGNLRLPLSEPMPYDLIREIVGVLFKENRDRKAKKK